MIHRRTVACSLILLCLHLATGSVHAADDWQACGYHPRAPAWTQTATNNDTSQTRINADHADISKQGVYDLQGNVQISTNGQHLGAGKANFDQQSGELEASDHLHYWVDSLHVSGHSGTFNLHDTTGLVNDIGFELVDRHGRGQARQARLLENNRTRLQSVRYTTCDPQDNSWWLRAGRMTLNHDRGIGHASNVLLTFKHVPLFYFPYMSFPIDEQRKTGFLAPELRQSDFSGNELHLPYYLNLAPNLDATLTPVVISRRGLMNGVEFRYLGKNRRGQLNGSYLQDDSLTGTDRSEVAFRHHDRLTRQLALDMEYNGVSDADYLTDFGNSAGASSVTHLPQQATLSYTRPGLAFSVLGQRWQTVDPFIAPAERPYQRMPQLSLDLSSGGSRRMRSRLALHAEQVDFRHDVQTDTRRAYLQPAVSLDFGTEGWFVKPALRYHHTRYEQEAGLTTRERTLTELTLDSGLFLERPAFGYRYLHTLEPRVYFVDIPYVDQSGLPVIDSGQPDLTFNRLFTANRFSGIDRIGDTRQYTLAVDTRLINSRTGRQTLHASIGQINWLEDRRVTLPGGNSGTTPRSDLLGQLVMSPASWLQLNSKLRLDAADYRVNQGSAGLIVNRDHRHRFGIAYRYRRDILEQGEASLLWPLSRHWTLVSHMQHSLVDNTTVEALGGLEYRSCCWNLRLAGRRYIADKSGTLNNAVYLQLELKGLTSIGQGIDNLLENGMLGATIRNP